MLKYRHNKIRTEKNGIRWTPNGMAEQEQNQQSYLDQQRWQTIASWRVTSSRQSPIQQQNLSLEQQGGNRRPRWAPRDKKSNQKQLRNHERTSSIAWIRQEATPLRFLLWDTQPCHSLQSTPSIVASGQCMKINQPKWLVDQNFFRNRTAWMRSLE